MRVSLQVSSALVLCQAILGVALPTAEKRATTTAASGPQFTNGQPDDGAGRGGPILGNSPFFLDTTCCHVAPEL